MNALFSILVVLCGVAAVVLAVIFLVRLIARKSKMWIGLSALFCVAGIIVFSIIGALVWINSMTPDEREAYYAEQQLEAEQRETERLEKEQAEDQESTVTEKQTDAPEPIEAPAVTETPEPIVKPTATPKPTPVPTPEAEEILFDDIYKAYKENELRADDKYQYNRYKITAKINGMNTGGLFNLTGGATLTMETRVNNTIVFFYAEFEKEQEKALKKVNVGDTITFEGECLSAGSWVDCKIVE